MKKGWILGVLLLGLLPTVFGRHIKGGEINYVYLGPGISGTDRFQITLRLFLECGASGQQLDPDANIGIFRNANETAVGGSPFSFPLVGDEFINLTTPNPCISMPSGVCYRLRTYSRTIDLPKDPEGYTMVFQRCCRINGLVNLSPNGNIGSSYTCKMYGTNVLGTGTNSSPAFAVKDTVLICQLRPFTLDFSAEDPDGDSLSYEFCDAYTAQQNGQGGVINPVPPSQIGFVSYAAGFSGPAPLGADASINPQTGKIAGIAPAGGDYVISVCVKEWRNGKVLSEHRKDFNLKVDQQCDLAAALLKPSYTNCDTLLQFFQNESPPSPLIKTYHWDFGVTSLTNDTSNLPSPSYRYSDTGVYKIKLVINAGDPCADSSESEVRLYPGFFPGFTIAGSCIQLPYQFNDTSKTRYGTINYWQWNLGDETSDLDETTGVRSLSWLYGSTGFKTVSLIVGSSKGCRDTLQKQIEVKEKPLVNLAFRDTLICSIDTLQLRINGPGLYQWSPAYNIINPGTASPFVYPKTTTWYKVDMNDNGCVNSDSVRVRVVDFVTVDAGNDTTICLTDTIRLNPITDGLRYQWSPAITLNDASLKNPLASPRGTTRYQLIASIGKCSASDGVTIRPVPYPYSYAGTDTVICFDDTAQLRGSVTGSRFFWTPAATLSNPGRLDPLAYPRSTTLYTLTVYDTLGCPKPGLSSALVTVRPKVNAFAGNDTVIVAGQPLQLRATGAPNFLWTPASYLSASNTPDPIALLPDNYRYILKAYTAEGCFGLDTINIKVYKTPPEIFVPNAFVPKGRNRLLRPVPVGISRLENFSVFNRWGQLVFRTTEPGKGWDGTVAGREQPSGTYVWIAQAIDYTGQKITRKGTALLIR